MKKSFYPVAIALFIIAAGFIAAKFSKDEKAGPAIFYPLKERKASLAQSPEAQQVKKQFDELMKVVKTNDDDTKSRLALAALYIQEARTTGDYEYYNMAAMKYVDEVLEINPQHFEALTYDALIHLSQHQFTEGLAIAEKARTINPDNAFLHGILVDANVELGNYSKAIEEADKMISLRPDLRSYSRVSYLREIHGDYPGAIEAMKLAVDAGMPGDEATEWARVHLGKLYEVIGDMKNAEMQYQIALQRRPSYAYAIAGQGRIALAVKEYNKAIAYFSRADSLISDHSFKEEMADAYEQFGEKDKAISIIKQLIEEIKDHSHHDAKQHDHIHYANLELAALYEKSGDYEEALEHAMIEYKRRPLNIEVNEMLAWIYYNKKEYGKALPHIDAAMKTKSNDPVLLYRAGLIYAKAGNKEKARLILNDAVKTRFTVSESLKEQGRAMLETL